MIADRYEHTAKNEDVDFKRVGWNNKERAIQRYEYLASLVCKLVNESSNSINVYDIGCGLCSLYDYISYSKSIPIEKVNYHGFDLSIYIVEEAKLKYPNLNIKIHDFLHPKSSLLTSSDISIMNGMFTQKFTLSREMMLSYVTQFLQVVKKQTKKLVVFNVMSDSVDYMLDEAFHMSKSEIKQLMNVLEFKIFHIDDNIPYEYHVSAYV